MRDHLTKAVGLHVADEVWQTVDRHLFADSSGCRHGPPRVGSWWDFTRIPGRARSHTKDQPTWETYRLTGTLDGHLAAYRHRQLPASVSTAHQAVAAPVGTSILAQPTRMLAPARPARRSWWDHDGALAVVFTGLPAGDLVLPVRLPSGAAQWPHLAHFLTDPSIWHKIDLVRVRDGKAPAAGATTRICRCTAADISHPRPESGELRFPSPASPVWTQRVHSARSRVPRRPPTTSSSRAARLHRLPSSAPRSRRRQGTGAAERVGSLPAQHQRRPIVPRCANTNAPRPRRGRAGGPRGQNPCGARAARSMECRYELPPRHALGPISAHRCDHAADMRRISQAKHARAAELANRIVAAHGNTVTGKIAASHLGAVVGQADRPFAPAFSSAPCPHECDAPAGSFNVQALDRPR